MSFSLSKIITSCFHHSPFQSQLPSSFIKIINKPVLLASLCYTHLPYQQHSFDSYSLQNSSRNPQLTIAEQPKLCLSEEFCSWVLSFCNSRSLKEGVCVHSLILKLGLQDHLYLNNNLLSVYAKCFGLKYARQLFDGMSCKDVVSWTGIISIYVRNESNSEALQLFDMMLISGSIPNEFTFSSILRSCSSVGEFKQGTRSHAYIIKLGFELNPVLGSALINFYAKCNHYMEASEIFASMNNGDTISWTTMISSSVQAQEWSRALRLYLRMIEVGISPNEFTFVKLLAASSFLSLEYGKLVHAHIIMWGIELNLVLKTALVDMYSKCQKMGDALKISNQTPDSDVLLWTAMISGYTQILEYEEAIAVFRKMEVCGILPNTFSYAGVLNACSSIPAPELGGQIHSRVIKVGLKHDVSVGNALVYMYMKCYQSVGYALQAFNAINSPNVVSWTSLIVGLAEHGFPHEAYRAFMKMRIMEVQPNSFTLSGILKGYDTVDALVQVRNLHTYIIKTKVYTDITIGNALVDAYARLRMVDDAWNVINMMRHRDAITYTSLATRINQMGRHEMTLDIINHMQNDDVKMDSFSLASFLSASANLATMEPGKQLHCYSVKSGYGSWISVSNGLVDLYGKCGSIHEAHKAFTEILKPNVVSWNGLIFGLASNGHFLSTLTSFEDMRLAGIQPDNITFLLVLYACSHSGMVDQGVEYFHFMSETYGITPQLDHYVCLVDLLSRAGWLEKAVGVIETMPFTPNALIYKTLLSSCRIHGNLALGEDMASRALELNALDPAIYVLLANLYEDAGRSELGERTRRMMKERGLRKNPGQSWMEIKNKVHLFTVGEQSHPQIKEIHEKIGSLMDRLKSVGYSYGDGVGSSYHSEKLAVACGLLNTSSMVPIRIIKNIRICRDCHTFISLVTKLVDREIIVRDGNRFHSFKKGECSCRGYW